MSDSVDIQVEHLAQIIKNLDISNNIPDSDIDDLIDNINHLKLDNPQSENIDNFDCLIILLLRIKNKTRCAPHFTLSVPNWGY